MKKTRPAGPSKKITRQSSIQQSAESEGQGLQNMKTGIDRVLHHSLTENVSFGLNPSNPKRLLAFKVRF